MGNFISLSCFLIIAVQLPTYTINGLILEEKYVIGVDLGTESARVGLFSRSGALIQTAAVSYTTTYPNIGWAEQNPENWWRCLGEACRKVTSAACIEKNIPQSSIEGICIDTTACSVVMLDRENKPIRNCLLWCDARSASQCEEILRTAKGDPSLQVKNILCCIVLHCVAFHITIITIIIITITITITITIFITTTIIMSGEL
jgi:FGGY family of carbohydrate kinases, N-terminal domain